MKKFILTMLVAMCSIFAMAQTVTITHNTMYNGVKSLECKMVWQSGQGGSYDICAYFADANGNYVMAKDENFADQDGYFCSWNDQSLQCNNNSIVTTKLWIPNSALAQHLVKGKSYYIYVSIYSGDIPIVEGDPLEIHMN